MDHQEKQYWRRRDFIVDLLKQLPVHVFWKNREGVYLGCNEAFAKSLGLSSVDEVVGKNDYALPVKKEQSDAFIANDKEVMKNCQPKLNIEEEQIFEDGRKVFLLTSKVPLLNHNGEVMGVLGVYYDITEQKKNQEEITRLKLENEAHQQFVKAQEKFTSLANQVVHDIRSPLASLLMIVKSCTAIPEADRIALREAAINIGDIANHLLSQYRKKEDDDGSAEIFEQRQPILVSTSLLQILTDKKYQYKDLSIKFDHDFHHDSHFFFIKAEPSAFKRMISNVINNAVESFDVKPGTITLQLESHREWVKITIQDNGKGMSQELIEKIKKNIPVTAGKESGHGIGLTQVRETLERNEGELIIKSEIGYGTQVTLIFPKIKSPQWMAEEITLDKSDIVIILDDDTSIHAAWKSRFDAILKEAPDIQLIHFQIGAKALSYIDHLTEDQKQRVFLLTDYELLKQELNGLHVVSKGGIRRSILVTSHAANPLIQAQTAKTGTKILPKHLASEIPIKISGKFKKIDGIIVDDDENYVTNLKLFVFSNQHIDHYYNPEIFLKNISQYAKDTKIFIDNNFSNSSLKGLDIARELHEQGFKNLYILSGETINSKESPNYFQVIRKDDIDTIQKLMDPNQID